ncbi:MAG: ATP-binding protein [Methanobrevibacter sp.]|jgi:hypothetical protein|nr:ATP-binding protein [Candidatus Methanoflexus mossambicus]
MDESIKDLPNGISTFSQMIENNYIYVDKTEYLYKLIKPGKKYFLSRPRRFGKSLLIDTMEELFEGNKKLFEGLYIYDKWDWSQSYPVLHLDMSGLRVKTPEIFENSLNKLVDEIAEEYSIDFINDDVKGKFGELIKKISIKTKKNVVVLVDEYDFPIIDNMNNLDVADKNRETLSEFYQILKTSGKYIHFIFLTGVSKFVKTSIFSKLNNLTDLTINPDYSAICGYTEDDLEEHFSYYIEELSKNQELGYEETIEKIKRCYDGYSWDGRHFLYNPSSIINTFFEKKFANYWFDTGTPTFLMDLVKKDNIDLNMFMDSDLHFNGTFPTWDLNNINFSTALLQTGYLTIKKAIKKGSKDKYLLGIPNREVESSLFNYLIAAQTDNLPEEVESINDDFSDYLDEENEEKLSQTLDRLIGNIPYHSHMKNWKYYQGIFSVFFMTTGLKPKFEQSNSQGRIDYVLHDENKYIIVELKYSQKKSIETMFDESWSQIAKKRYYQTYQDKNLMFLTIAIRDTEAKEVQCQIKTLEEIKKIKTE